MLNRLASILKQSLGKNGCFWPVFRHFSHENDYFWTVLGGFFILLGCCFQRVSSKELDVDIF